MIAYAFCACTLSSRFRFWRKVVSEPVEKYEKDVGIDREENMFETLKATISDLSQTSRSGSPHNISIDAERTQQVLANVFATWVSYYCPVPQELVWNR